MDSTITTPKKKVCLHPTRHGIIHMIRRFGLPTIYPDLAKQGLTAETVIQELFATSDAEWADQYGCCRQCLESRAEVG